MAIIMPSIDISNGMAVKRVRGLRGTGITIGNPVKVAETLYSMGYEHVHVVDLDAAEGTGSNEELIRRIAGIGFRWVQVGGGIRSLEKAFNLISCGASALVVSSVYFRNRDLFQRMVREVGSDKIILALDYRSDGHVYVSGWMERGPRLADVLNEVHSQPLLGVLFTFIDSEGTMRGVDRGVAAYVSRVRGLKEYAGGVSSPEDVDFLSSIGFDYVIVGMAFYKGVLGGKPYAKGV